MSITFSNIKEEAANTYAGVSFAIYWALWDWVLTWPTTAVAPTTPQAEVEYVDNIVMKTGFQFYEIQLNQQNSQNIITPIGENGNISFQNRLTIHKSGIPKDFFGLVHNLKNKRLVVLAQDLCGDMRMIGNQCAPAMMYPEGEFTTGTQGGTKMSQIILGNDGPPAYYYPGVIPLTPAP